MFRPGSQQCPRRGANRSGGSFAFRFCVATYCCVLSAFGVAAAEEESARPVDGLPAQIAGPLERAAQKPAADETLRIDALLTQPLATGDETSQARIDAVIAPYLGEATQQYKSNVGGQDEGPFAADYTTTFTGDDPNGALIEWLGSGVISDATRLLVKDGNADPAWYLFDVSGWDGRSTIELVNFWLGPRGAISHVTVYGGKGTPPVHSRIQIEKTAGIVTDNGDGSLSVPITLTVTNSGEDLLTGLQVEDSLDIFRSGRLLDIEDLDAAGLSLNPDYDGLTDTAILTGADELEVSQSATIAFTLRFDPGDES